MISSPEKEKKSSSRNKSGGPKSPNANAAPKDYSDWKKPTSPFVKIGIGVAVVLALVTGVMYLKEKNAKGGGEG